MSSLLVAAVNYANNGNCQDEKYKTLAKVAFMQGANYALKNQWIKTRDKLPDPNEQVLYLCRGCMGCAKGSLVDPKNGFTYWMPIPKINKGR